MSNIAERDAGTKVARPQKTVLDDSCKYLDGNYSGAVFGEKNRILNG
ncbi:hypothetical protein [Larkinella ripae]